MSNINTHSPSWSLSLSSSPPTIADAVGELENLKLTYTIFRTKLDRISQSGRADPLFLKNISSLRSECHTIFDFICPDIRKTANQVLHAITNSHSSKKEIQEATRIVQKINWMQVKFQKHLPYLIALAISRIFNLEMTLTEATQFSKEPSLLVAALKKPFKTLAEELIATDIDSISTETKLSPKENVYLFHQAMQKNKTKLAALSFFQIHDPKIQNELASTYTYQAIAQCLDTAWAMKQFKTVEHTCFSYQTLRGLVPHIQERSLRSLFFIHVALLRRQPEQLKTQATALPILDGIGALILSGGIDVHYLLELTDSRKQKILTSPLFTALYYFKDLTMALTILGEKPSTLNTIHLKRKERTVLNLVFLAEYLKKLEGAQYTFVDMLLQQGADPNIVDIDGNTALHLAVLLLDQSIFSLPALIKNTNMTHENDEGHTPLFLLFTARNTLKVTECLKTLFPHCPVLIETVRQSHDPVEVYQNAYLAEPVHFSEFSKFSPNPLEIPFLLGGERVIDPIIKKLQITQDIALQHIKELAEKYPASARGLQQYLSR